MDNDLLLLRVGILVDACFVHVEDERCGDVVEELLGCFHPALNVLVVEGEAGCLDWCCLDKPDNVSPLQRPSETVPRDLFPLELEDFLDDVVKRHRVGRTSSSPDPLGDRAEVVVGQFRRSASELCVGIPGLQNRPDALAVGDVEELGKLRVGDFSVEVVVFKEVLGEVDLLAECPNRVEGFVSGEATKGSSEVASRPFREATTGLLDGGTAILRQLD